MMRFEKFKKLAQEYNVIPLHEELLVDMETPVSVFQRFRQEPYSFLLESVEGQERWAQYSFIGFKPLELFRSVGRRVESKKGSQPWKKKQSADPLHELAKQLKRYRQAPTKGLPRFSGGAVGYAGYDMVRFIERLPGRGQKRTDPWDSYFMIPQVLLVFDNREHVIHVLYHVPVTKRSDLKKAYQSAVEEMKKLIDVLRTPLEPSLPKKKQIRRSVSFRPLWQKRAFMKAVRRTQEYIRAGDCIQTVLSLRFKAKYSGDSFNIYRSLRQLNPSPYLYYLQMGDHEVVGASPETMVRLEEGELNVRPIAGTRPRGRNKTEDKALAQELLADPKERAEHIMLVDLGRNDVGRVAVKGSVDVNEFMNIERYSHVMHIVSNVQAQLLSNKDAFDVLVATFPAGTLSGAPKVRAMQIIDEFEPTRRGVYGGCVGYIDFSGNMDTAIAIRTAIIHDGHVSIQAGAGIVLDSKPEQEYQECLNKARAVLHAVELAEQEF